MKLLYSIKDNKSVSINLRYRGIKNVGTLEESQVLLVDKNIFLSTVCYNMDICTQRLDTEQNKIFTTVAISKLITQNEL